MEVIIICICYVVQYATSGKVLGKGRRSNIFGVVKKATGDGGVFWVPRVTPQNDGQLLVSSNRKST